MQLSKGLREFIELLNSNGVEYLVVGGFGNLSLTAADLTRPDQIIQLGAKPNRIDLLTSISGVGFETAWPHREQGSLDGLPVAFMGLDDLLRNKDSTGRPQDLADAGELRKRRRKTQSDL